MLLFRQLHASVLSYMSAVKYDFNMSNAYQIRPGADTDLQQRGAGKLRKRRRREDRGAFGADGVGVECGEGRDILSPVGRGLERGSAPPKNNF